MENVVGEWRMYCSDALNFKEYILTLRFYNITSCEEQNYQYFTLG